MARIQITGVIHQRQLNPRACWYTCLQMAVRYHESIGQHCLSDLAGPEMFPDMQRRFAGGGNPSWAEWRTWAQRCGFSPLDLCPGAMGIYDTLGKWGPIIYSGTWGQTFDGHVVVITGIDTDGPTVYVDDPLELSAPVSRDMNAYFANLAQTLWENPLFVY